MPSNPAFAGVDVGSLATKAIIIQNGSIVGKSLIRTSINTEESGLTALNQALESASLSKEDLKYIVGTGYGRVSAPYANKTITEISCHGRGAHYLHPNTRTIIDIGGQDCKAIRLDKTGTVVDFVMNDKCAAGTGRFLEVMANVFKVDIQNLGPLALSAKEIVPMSSTCTVFAESETISLLARGEKPENIIKGIHYAIGNRIAGMLSRIGVESDVFFSGGVAKNVGMKAALEDTLEAKIVTVDFDPQLVGALGAAVLAKEHGERGA